MVRMRRCGLRRPKQIGNTVSRVVIRPRAGLGGGGQAMHLTKGNPPIKPLEMGGNKARDIEGVIRLGGEKKTSPSFHIEEGTSWLTEIPCRHEARRQLCLGRADSFWNVEERQGWARIQGNNLY